MSATNWPHMAHAVSSSIRKSPVTSGGLKPGAKLRCGRIGFSWFQDVDVEVMVAVPGGPNPERHLQTQQLGDHPLGLAAGGYGLEGPDGAGPRQTQPSLVG